MDPAAGLEWKLLIENLRIPGVILVIWWFSNKAHEKTLAQYRETLAQYRDDVTEQRRMYENNIEPVKNYQALAGDLREIVVLNTRCLTQMSDEIKLNQFSPLQRTSAEMKKDQRK